MNFAPTKTEIGMSILLPNKVQIMLVNDLT